MTSQATSLCLLLAIALSSSVEQGIILGSVINMDGQPWTSQERGDDPRWLLEERRKGLPELETEHIVDSMRIFNGRRPRVRRIRPHRMYNWGQAHMLRSSRSCWDCQG